MNKTTSKTNENVEANIKKCAEDVFLERGFAGTKTTEIASRAGVNHAMLHYYYRTKQNLFNVIFQEKLSLLASSFTDAFNSDLPFLKKLEQAIQRHFDFVRQNPRLVFFIYFEITNDKSQTKAMFNELLPNLKSLFHSLDLDLKSEINQGHIRPIETYDLLLNVFALNVTTFMTIPFLNDKVKGDDEVLNHFLEERKKNNVDFIMKAILNHASKPSAVQTSLSFDF